MDGGLSCSKRVSWPRSPSVRGPAAAAAGAAFRPQGHNAGTARALADGLCRCTPQELPRLPVLARIAVPTGARRTTTSMAASVGLAGLQPLRLRQDAQTQGHIARHV